MLNRIDIRNFKCFQGTSVPLNALTIFSGINGVGKSTTIQSLLLLRQSLLNYEQRKRMAILNGPLVSLGYSEDILYENATTDEIHFSLYTDNQVQEFAFLYEKSARELVMKQCPEIPCGSLFEDSFAYLNAERIGPRVSFSIPIKALKTINAIGNQGEYCAWLLSLTEEMPVPVKSLCDKAQPNDHLRTQTEYWLSRMGQPVHIHLDNHKDMDNVSMQFSFVRVGSRNYRPTNVGFGYTYCLPILVAVLMASPGAVICLENPEAHLHPKAQTIMGEFLARAAAGGIQILMETHSDHILNGVRIATKRGLIEPDEVALNFLYHQDGDMFTSIMTPHLDKDGRIPDWPDGFFDEWENSLTELL